MAALGIAVAGAALGAATLGTGPVLFGLTGTAIGWTAGTILGGFLFPPPDFHSQGPRLEDQRVTSSAYGLMVPIGYGTFSVAGNLMDASAYYETAHTSTQSGGKGGGGQEVSTTTYTYSVDLALAICEGAIDGIQQVYANEKLIYDIRPNSDVVKKAWVAMKIYTGTETQDPDPTLEAIHTSVPGYRGLAYVVFTRMELAEFGNRPPNFRFVVVVDGDATVSENTVDYDRNTQGHTYNPSNGLMYATLYNASVSTRPTLAAIDPLSKTKLWTSEGWDGSDDIIQVDDVVCCGYINTDVPPKTKSNSLIAAAGIHNPSGWRIGFWDADSGECLSVESHEYGYQINSTDYIHSAYPDGNVLYFGLTKTLGGGQYKSFGRAGWGYTGGSWNRKSVRLTLPSGMTRSIGDHVSRIGVKQGSIATGNNAFLGFALEASSGGHAYFGIIEDDVPSVTPYFDGGDPDASWPVNWRSNTYIAASPWDIVHIHYDDVADTWWLMLNNQSATQEPRWVNVGMDGVIIGDYDWPTDYGFTVNLKPNSGWRWQGIDTDGGFIWMELVDGKMYRWDIRALSAPVQYTGFSGANHYTYVSATDSIWSDVSDDVVEYLYNRLDSNTVTLASIVGDLCDRSDIDAADYDAAALASVDVRGYLISRLASARAAMEPLRQGFLFDAADTGADVVFKLMGQSLDRTLDGDDVGAHTTGESMPAFITVHREQEIELPRELTVNYLDPGANYEIGTQRGIRQASRSVQKTNLDLPIVFTHGEAAKQADVLLHLAHIEREHYEARLMPVHSDLIPTDVIAVDDGTTSFRMRVIEKTLENGYFRIRGVRDEASILTSTAAGAEITGRDTEIGLLGIMQTWILNIPALRYEDHSAGFYAAGFSYSPGWPGGVVMKSTSSSEWARFGAITAAASVGFTNNSFDAAVLGRWDHSNDLEINFIAGDGPSSDSEINVLNGSNVAAWGVQGRYEIVQWVTATLESDGSYTLSQLLRGRMGTEQYTDDHSDRDRFIILDEDTIRRFTVANANIGTSIDYLGVTLGLNVFDENNISQTFTHDGRALEPWGPIHIAGTRDGSNNLTVTWTRRDRVIARPLWTPAMSEDSESYEIDVIDGGVPTTNSPYTTVSETWTYTAAEQTADGLTPGDPVEVNIYQISATVDRGLGGEAIV